jgi:hypothetical protein
LKHRCYLFNFFFWKMAMSAVFRLIRGVTPLVSSNRTDLIEGSCPLRCWILLVLPLLLCFGGCRQAAAPDYERLRSQMILELFEHMADANAADSLPLLKRLEEISPALPFFPQAHSRQQRLLCVQQLNRLLHDGKLEEARQTLSEQARDGLDAPLVSTWQQGLDSLTALDAYCLQLPYPNSGMATSALQTLTPHLDTLNRHPDFSAWLEQQKRQISELRQREHRQTMRKLIQDCDRIAISNSAKADEILKKIAGADPVLAKIVSGAGQPDFSSSEEDSLADAALKLQEIVRWRALSNGQGNIAIPADPQTPPRSLAGQAVQAYALASQGRTAEAVDVLAKISRQARVEPSQLSPFLTRFILPREQFLARPWRSPFPGVTDYLNRLGQIGEQRKKQ